MAEIKQGLNYEITADDKASAVADKASKNVQKSSKEAGEAFKGEFNPMSAVLAGISGNTQALAQQMLGLVSRMKSVHMTMMKFSLYAGFVMVVVQGVKALVDHLRQARVAADSIRLEKAQASLENLRAEQERLNKEFDIGRAKTEAIRDSLLTELSVTEKLTAARREYNKALELSLAKTDEEKSAVERKYSLQASEDAAANEKIRIKADRDKTIKDIASWRKQIKEYEESIKGARDDASWASKTQASTAKRIRSAKFFWHFGVGEDAAINENASNVFTQALADIESYTAAINELKVKITQGEEALRNLDTAEETVEMGRETERIKTETAARDAAKAAAEAKSQAEAEAKAKENAHLAAEKRLADQKRTEMEKVAQKAADDEAKAIKAAQLKAHKEVMDQRRKDLAAITEQESQAAARVAAAQSKVAEAWGWYRDKDKMAAQLKEEKAEEAAQKQFEKDFKDLKWRRDWRTAKDLSVDQEAVRRVALAKEEETAAQKALAETAKSTAQAAASLAEIEKVITQEG